MINKVYIWNDLLLLKKNINKATIEQKLQDIQTMLESNVEILDGIESEYVKEVNRLKNIVTIGTRPNLFLKKNKRKYKIISKRVIAKSGFANDCKLDVDERIYKLNNVNIVEDIIVSGTTMKSILQDLYSKNPKVKVNIYFLIGYEEPIKELKEKFVNLNVYCFNTLKEKPVEESTCMFLSDILYEKLGDKTYIEHIRNLNLFNSNTEPFIAKIKEIKDSIKLKAGIITITIGINYGNRLQNYALQRALNKLCIDATTFENVYEEETFKNKVKRYFALKKKNKIFKLKLQRFKEFNNKYIKIGERIKSYSVPKNLNSSYDYFICGSDQIWNPYFSGNTGTNFAAFAPKEKRIAYAPSFGVSNVPMGKVEEFKEYLRNMHMLSCREVQGAKIIKDITGRDAEVVLDPVMLLDKNEWEQISKRTKYVPSKEYICTYFLGNVENEYKDYITKVAKDNNLEVFNIMDMSDMDRFSTDPSEFIYLIKNAKLICTDSFHGMAFSIIFNKSYVLFERKSNMENMNSRFESLKNILELPNRNYDILKKEEIFNIDYRNINENIEIMREKSIEYLKQALNLWE